MNIDKYKTENGYTSKEGGNYEDAEEFLQVYILKYCGCGRPEENLKYIGIILRYIHNLKINVWSKEKGKKADESYKQWVKEGKKIGTEQQLYFAYYALDTLGLTEHGGGVPGWLTEKGIAFMEDIDELYKDSSEDLVKEKT